jgi:hypothetical protein
LLDWVDVGRQRKRTMRRFRECRPPESSEVRAFPGLACIKYQVSIFIAPTLVRVYYGALSLRDLRRGSLSWQARSLRGLRRQVDHFKLSWGCAQVFGNRLTSIEALFVREVLCIWIGEVSLLVSDSSGGEKQISRISMCLGGQRALIPSFLGAL